MRSSGWPARYPLLQPPNAEATVAWGLRGVAAVTDGRTRELARIGHRVVLGYWAYRELTDGANLVRRALGALVLARLAAAAWRAR
jgi:hypothetical protein